MTVREVVGVLTQAQTLFICWNDNLRTFDPTDELMMDAYGDYKVKRICNAGDKREEFEIAIASVPVREVPA